MFDHDPFWIFDPHRDKPLDRRVVIWTLAIGLVLIGGICIWKSGEGREGAMDFGVWLIVIGAFLVIAERILARLRRR